MNNFILRRETILADLFYFRFDNLVSLATSGVACLMASYFKKSAAGRPDLDSSTEIIDDTPDSSPLPARTKLSAHRISDSGISDGGTKSKSVSPEERVRSPQIILDSDDEVEESKDSETYRDELVPESDSDDDVPLVNFHHKIDGLVSSDVDSGDESSSSKDRSFSKDSNDIEDTVANLSLSSDPNPRPSLKPLSKVRGRHDDSLDSPLVRATMARTCVDSLDTPISQNQQRSKAAKAPSTHSPALHRRDSPSPVSSKTVKSKIHVIESSDDNEGATDQENDGKDDSFDSVESNNGNISEEFEMSPSKSSSCEQESVCLTPPPATSPVQSKPLLLVKEFAKSTVSPLPTDDEDEENFNFQPSKSNEAVIDLVDSDEEEIKVVADPVKAPTVASYTMKDVQELESSIQKKQTIITQNSYMLAQQHTRLPDGGKALRDTISR